MNEIYAKIQNGIVVNVQVVNPGDFLDPNCTWVDVTGMDPQPSIGWTYDGTNFYPPQGG